MAEELVVTLNRGDSSGFGFSLLGTAGLPHVIYDIVENSPAAKCGKVNDIRFLGRLIVSRAERRRKEGREGGWVVSSGATPRMGIAESPVRNLPALK
ncbi:hypothetical protein KM043_006360 [Ampulex compressa]|nr:hypothetical protein KM043_006360 [Ampulex compressa]